MCTRLAARAAFAALLVAAAGHAACAAQLLPLTEATAEAFLVRLAGAWRGEAVTTPIGPRPYDIRFEWKDGELAGAAEPGGATHHWAFSREGARIGLRFLSTFRGNRTPTLLDAVGVREGAVQFRARTPDFLAVAISVDPDAAQIRVLHHERLHVEIRLRRP